MLQAPGRAAPRLTGKGRADGVDVIARVAAAVARVDAGGRGFGLVRVRRRAAGRIRERRRAARVGVEGAQVAVRRRQAAERVVGGALEAARRRERGVVVAGEGLGAVGGGDHARLDARARRVVGRAAGAAGAAGAARAAGAAGTAASAGSAAAAVPATTAAVAENVHAHVAARHDEREHEEPDPFPHAADPITAGLQFAQARGTPASAVRALSSAG